MNDQRLQYKSPVENRGIYIFLSFLRHPLLTKYLLYDRESTTGGGARIHQAIFFFFVSIFCLNHYRLSLGGVFGAQGVIIVFRLIHWSLSYYISIICLLPLILLELLLTVPDPLLALSLPSPISYCPYSQP